MNNAEIKMIALDGFEKGFMTAANLITKNLNKEEKKAFWEEWTPILEAEMKLEEKSWDIAFTERASQ